MATYVKTNKELYHHGVLGQQWGVRNGPPYPLDSGDHSASEKRAGWKKSLDDQKIGPHRERRFTNKQIVGMAFAAAGAASLAAIGAYSIVKLHGSDELVRSGRAIVKGMEGTAELLSNGTGKYSPLELADKTGFNIKKDHFSIEEDCSAINPRYNALGLTKDYNNNCPSCTFAYTMRRMGMDVQSVPIKDGLTYSEINSVFKGCIDDSYQAGGGIINRVDFEKSFNKGIDKLISKDSSGKRMPGLGAVIVNGDAGGHIFPWEVTSDGAVHLIDPQPNWTKSEKLLKRYNNLFDAGLYGQMNVLRFDDKEIDFDNLKKWVKNY